MGVIVAFTGPVFRHGISEADIRHAIKTRIYAAMMQEFPEKYGVTGFDRAGNPLEVMYNPIDNNHILIFHAMKLRESFKKQPGLQETIMARMTEAEARGLDDITRTWLSVKAKADNKSPAQIINEMVHEKIAAASA